jgi:hypothetical protein
VKPDIPRHVIAVLNTHTGEVSGVYRLPHEPEGISSAACAASQDTSFFSVLPMTSNTSRSPGTAQRIELAGHFCFLC